MTSAALLELADRVERLGGPDREVDARIAHAICWRWDGWEEGDLRVEDRQIDWFIDRVKNSHNSIYRHTPAYTASLDAAMTLAPDESDPLDILEVALATARDERDGVFFLPLHIVASALRARAQETNP